MAWSSRSNALKSGVCAVAPPKTDAHLAPDVLVYQQDNLQQFKSSDRSSRRRRSNRISPAMFRSDILQLPPPPWRPVHFAVTSCALAVWPLFAVWSGLRVGAEITARCPWHSTQPRVMAAVTNAALVFAATRLQASPFGVVRPAALQLPPFGLCCLCTEVLRLHYRC
jgi:hypothetical protein